MKRNKPYLLRFWEGEMALLLLLCHFGSIASFSFVPKTDGRRLKIRLVEKQPDTSWFIANPSEYGFYSNVNPEVDHPRWSQASERRISDDKSIFSPKIKTLKFNGYGDQVASLYAGMDLKKFY
jgi:hypothetical protein